MITITMTPPEDTIFNIPLLIHESEKAVRETNRDARKMLDDTKKSFSSESQFEFKEEHKLTKNEVSASTSTTDENWIRLNQGFFIPPVEGKFMAFQADYRPKTRPFDTRSRPGGPSGPWVYTYERKGTEVQGRGWIITVYSLLRGTFFKRIDRAYTIALRG